MCNDSLTTAFISVFDTKANGIATQKIIKSSF